MRTMLRCSVRSRPSETVSSAFVSALPVLFVSVIVHVSNCHTVNLPLVYELLLRQSVSSLGGMVVVLRLFPSLSPACETAQHTVGAQQMFVE